MDRNWPPEDLDFPDCSANTAAFRLLCTSGEYLFIATGMAITRGVFRLLSKIPGETGLATRQHLGK